jgi:serine protease Do
VLTIGYPLDLPLTPSFGTIGGFDINVGNSYFATRHIRANLPVQRGEGGAPLLNMQGEVIGILIASLDGGRASYALPIEAAEKVRMDFLRFGDVRPGWIGIEIEPGEAISGSTARVADLLPEGPGVRAGLRKGDVILKVGDRTVQSPEDVRDAAFFITAQDELGITVLRDGGELQLAVQPVDPPGASRTAFGGQQPPAPMPTLSQPEVRASLPLHQDP